MASINNGLHHQILKLAKKHLPTSPSSSSPSPISIYEIPSTLRNVKPVAFDPRVVSIGLINRCKIKIDNNPYLDMDKQKEIYMSSLFQQIISRSGESETFDKTVCLYVDSMITEADKANNCYPDSCHLDPDTTARIMLLDGCFILELLVRWLNPGEDSIIQNRSNLNNIVHDLLLVENQIPFFILEKLFELTVEQIPNIELVYTSSFILKRQILDFFADEINSHFKSVEILSGPDFEIKDEPATDHMLGLVHSYYLPQKSECGDYMITRYSATELSRSGIKFKPSKNKKVYLDVRFQTHCLFSWFPSIIKSIFLFPRTLAISIYKTKFHSSPPSAARELPLFMPKIKEDEMKSARASCCWFSLMCQLCRRATLELPELCITDSTESFLRNLIAYEQTSDVQNYFISYAFLMDTIINTKEDIEMLETAGVLKNYLGSRKVAAILFNSLCTNVNLSNNRFHFSGQWKQVDDYYKHSWANMIGSLKVTYFSNPWTGISVVAALVLFAFTGLQTACAIIQTWYS